MHPSITKNTANGWAVRRLKGATLARRQAIFEQPVGGSLRRLLALNVISVSRGGIGFGLGLRRLLVGAQVSGAVVAAIFNVVVLRERGNHGRASPDLAEAVEAELSRHVVEVYRSGNFQCAAF